MGFASSSNASNSCITLNFSKAAAPAILVQHSTSPSTNKLHGALLHSASFSHPCLLVFLQPPVPFLFSITAPSENFPATLNLCTSPRLASPCTAHCHPLHHCASVLPHALGSLCSLLPSASVHWISHALVHFADLFCTALIYSLISQKNPLLGIINLLRLVLHLRAIPTLTRMLKWFLGQSAT